MDVIASTTTRWIAAGMIGFTSVSCTGLEPLVDVLAGGGTRGQGSQVRGEVSSIDSRRQELRIQTAWFGSDLVRYDSRTQVVYGSRRYAVRDLERGDRVHAWISNRGQRRYATRIEVLESVRDRRVGIGEIWRVERIDGSVTRIDTRRRSFELRPHRGGPAVVVLLPANASRSIEDSFRRLRRGQSIRVEGYIIDGSRVQLRRFL